MENQNQQQAATALCRGGCGFFGSSATEGLCSKCFKDTIKRKQDTARLSSPNSSSTSSTDAMAKIREAVKNVPEFAAQLEDVAQSLCSSASSSSEKIVPEILEPVATPSPAEEVAVAASSAPVKKANRCQMCKKRVGLTGFTCRCGGLFCSQHRYVLQNGQGDGHDCEFDYKTMEREEIRKNNPVIVSDKIQRI